MWLCVLACLSSALTLSRLVSHHHRWMWLPWQRHVGSTRSVQPLFLLFLSDNWLTPPNNVFKAAFFTVWCLFYVPVACAAVNRHLESCGLFVLCVCACVFWFVSSKLGAIIRSVSVTGRCACCQLLSVLAISDIYVIETVFRWKQRGDRYVKKHVFVRLTCVWFVFLFVSVCCGPVFEMLDSLGF